MDYRTLTSLLGMLGTGQQLLAAVLLGGVILLGVYKPERIENPVLYRLSAAFLAISIVIHPTLILLREQGLGVGPSVSISILFVLPHLLLAAAIFSMVLSLRTGRSN